jgi:uncharacterized protein DUF6338
MIPDALGAFLAFLGIVAPGILFELRQEKRRVGVTGWSFRDISTVALVGFALTSAATLLTFALGRWWFGAAAIVDPKAWAQQGSKYFTDHFYLVVGDALVVFAVSLLLSLGVAKLSAKTRRNSGALAKQSLWHQAFRDDAPDGTLAWVHVELTDGSAFFGYVRANTEGEEVDKREITLTGARLSHRPAPDSNGVSQPVKVIGDRWSHVIVRSSEIRYLRVQYIDDRTGEVNSGGQADEEKRPKQAVA